MPNNEENSFRPLAGVRVVELTGEMSMLTGRILGDLGAEVIRVEPPGGDSVRRLAPFAKHGPELERSLVHQHYNAGKRSVICALETLQGREQLKKLLDTADLFILEEALGAKWGLSDEWYEMLSHDLIRVLIRAFPPESPRAESPASDLVGIAAGGELYLCGFPNRSPLYPGGQLAYGMVSCVAAVGALVGLVQRSRGGGAREISTNMQEAVAVITTEQANINAWLARQVVATRHGQSHPMFGGTYQAGDGGWLVFNFIDFSIVSEWLAEEGICELGAEWQDLDYRVAGFAEKVNPHIAELCQRHSVDELVDEGQRRGLYNMRINRVDEVLEHPIHEEREFFFPMAREQLGISLPLQRLPYRTARGQSRPSSGAPELGEHTEDLLASAEKSAREKTETRPNESPSPDPTQLLHKIRVIEICSAIAGPLATRIFSNLGAEVIKVESKKQPDMIRMIGFTVTEGPKTQDTGSSYNDLNTSKLSVKLNLKSPDAIKIVLELVAHADVLIDNFGDPGTMEKLGLSLDALRAAKPDLISISSSTLGKNSIEKGYRAFGTGITATAGLNAISGAEGEAPIGLGVAHSDYTGPYLAATTLLAALYERDRTGEGVHIDMSQLEGAAWLLDTWPMEYAVTGKHPKRLDNRSRNIAPHGLYRCLGDDAWCAISVADVEQWRRLCTTIGRDDLADDTDLATLTGRKAAEDHLDSVLGEWCAQRDVWDASQQLNAAGVPASPVESNRDFAENDVGMRGFYTDIEHPDGVTLRVMGDPLRVDGQRLPIRRAPKLGEHTQRILGDLLDYTPEQITQFEADGVIV